MPMQLLPTEVKRNRGTLQKCRTNPHEPQPTGEVGDPPSYFAADERACWRELKRITVTGVLTLQDRWAVEIACLLMAKVRRREVLLGCERSQLSSCIGRLGLSPADRARITVAPPATANPFAEFAVHAVT